MNSFLHGVKGAFLGATTPTTMTAEEIAQADEAFGLFILSILKVIFWIVAIPVAFIVIGGTNSWFLQLMVVLLALRMFRII